MVSSNNPRLLLFTISGLITTAFVNAQNASCPNQQEFRIVNATGQHDFTWNSSYASDDPWYVSVLIGAKGPEWENGFDVRANAFISVPESASNGTEVCIYQYRNINATLESGGENSCSGVISSGCIDHLTKALSVAANTCPDADTGSSSDAFNQACPMLKGGSHSSKFVDVTNSTCTYPSLPQVQIPDQYSTFPTVVGLDVSDTTYANADANKTYDLLTRQTIPLVLLGKFVDPNSNLVEKSVQFVCMNANKTVEGSRIPEQQTPWQSVGVDMSARMVGWAAAMVTAVMLVL